MSGIDGLALDAEGFIDMDQFPDDGTDLSDADLTLLRDALHSDPVDEPTADEWESLFEGAMDGAEEPGPFAFDGSDVDLDAAASVTDEGDLDGTFDVDPSDDDLDLDLDSDSDIDLDSDSDIDLEVGQYDDDGIDVSVDVAEDAFADDAVDDVPADIANNDFEDLL